MHAKAVIRAQRAESPLTGAIYVVFKKFFGFLQMGVDGIRASEIGWSSNVLRWNCLDHFETGIWQAEVFDP